MNTKRQTPWRLLAAIVLALGLAIAPFAVLGAAFEEQVLDWFQQPWSAAARFWAVVLILASDLFLPIPSSAVCTYAGAQLGFVAATASGWLGMTIGAMLGYSLARVAGWAACRGPGFGAVREGGCGGIRHAYPVTRSKTIPHS